MRAALAVALLLAALGGAGAAPLTSSEKKLLPVLKTGDYQVAGRPSWFVPNASSTLSPAVRSELTREHLSDETEGWLEAKTPVRVLSAAEFEDEKLGWSVAFVEVLGGRFARQRGWLLFACIQRASGGQGAAPYGEPRLQAVDAAGKPLVVAASGGRQTTPLHEAAAGADIWALQAALRPELLGAVNARGMTPLHLASENGRVEVSTALCEAGSPLEARDDLGRTPLYLAAAKGHYNVVRILIERGSNVEAAASDGYTPLLAAARLGSVETVDFLLAAGANANARDTQGRTALTLASGSKVGNWRQVERSLKAAGGRE